MQELSGVVAPGLGVALSPFPIIAVILVLGSRQAARNGLLFGLGWVLGLAALTGVLVAVFGGAASADDAGALGAWAKILVGAALIALAARKWRGRPADDATAEMPGWMSAVDGLDGVGALRLGAMLGGLNPKNVAFGLAASSTIVDSGGAAAAALYLLVASSSVGLLVGAHVVAGERAQPMLERVRSFMVRHNTLIVVVVLVVLGAMLVLEGLGAR